HFAVLLIGATDAVVVGRADGVVLDLAVERAVAVAQAHLDVVEEATGRGSVLLDGVEGLDYVLATVLNAVGAGGAPLAGGGEVAQVEQEVGFPVKNVVVYGVAIDALLYPAAGVVGVAVVELLKVAGDDETVVTYEVTVLAHGEGVARV